MGLGSIQFEGMLQDIDNVRNAKAVRNAIRSWEDRAMEAEDGLCGNYALGAVLELFISEAYPGHPLLRDTLLRDRIVAAGASAGNIANSYGAAREAGRTFRMPPEVIAPVKAQAAKLAAFDDLQEQLAVAKKDEAAAVNLVISASARAVEASKDAAQAKAALVAANSETVAARSEMDAMREELEAAHARIASQERALESMTRDCVHHMAQSAAFRENLAQANPGHPLVVDVELRRRVAVHAYDEFVLAGAGSNRWNIVREVGRNWAMPKSVFQVEEVGAEAVGSGLDVGSGDEGVSDYLSPEDVLLNDEGAPAAGGLGAVPAANPQGSADPSAT